MKAAAIIVAAGRGNRAGGDVPKQLRMLLGRPVLSWSVAAFAEHAQIAHIVIVTRVDLIAETQAMCANYTGKNVDVVAGGETRAQSVLAGLTALTLQAQAPVLIHDAARPGISQTMITDLLAAIERASAAAPALPVSDALKRTMGETLQNIERAGLSLVQTPQVFRFAAIQEALSGAGRDVADDLQAIEEGGGTVALIPGDTRLHKLTYAQDFAMLERLLGASAPPRIGKGYDVHAFGPGEHVTLCGVRIAHSASLEGHSDADVGWHALTDAILGALALGDIGDHFPPSDPQWKGAKSGIFLKQAARLAQSAGYAVSNCDITLVCEAPKIAPHRAAMRAATADLLGIDISMVSIKATTTEGLGFTGRGEGIAAEALAVMSPLPDSNWA